MEKKSFFHPSCLYLLVCFQGFRPHFVLLPFCYCLNIGSGEPTAASHEPITQQWKQRNKYLLNNVHFLCLLYFPWLQRDLQESQTWSWWMIYASYIYFFVVFVHSEAFTDLNGRSVCAYIRMEVRWYAIHATNNHVFSLIPEQSTR